MIRGAQAAEGGLQGAGACSGPRGSPGQHARLWVSRCRLLKRRSSIVGGRSIFSNFQHPPESSMIRGAQAAEGGLQGAGACSGPRGSPGQHARLWVSRCRLLKRRSSIVGGRSIFSNFQHPPESSMIRGAQAAEGGLQGAGACSGPRGSPGQHARLWVSRCRLLKRRSSIFGVI
jgi:ribosomal protein L19E